MLFLLLMYFAPLLAVALFWQAKRVALGEVFGTGDEVEEASPWRTIRAAIGGHAEQGRSVIGALLFAAAALATAAGLRGAGAFFAGALMATFCAALAHAAALATAQRELGRQAGPETLLRSVWQDSAAIAMALAAVATGCLGTLAWFFADPAGAVVLVTFVAGATAGALFLAMTLAQPTRRTREGLGQGEEFSRLETMARELAARTATGPLQIHLAAVAAAVMIAASAESETFLGLGGLMAESETLRSELLLLPIAVAVVSPVISLATTSLLASLMRRGSERADRHVERVAAVFAAMLFTFMVVLADLAWAVAGAFAIGVAARQIAVAADDSSRRSRKMAGFSLPSPLPVVLSGVALYTGYLVADWYGIGLAALGMTATFVSSSAASVDLEFADLRRQPAPPMMQDFDAASSAAGLAATLALLAAAAPVAGAEAVHRGAVVLPVIITTPALLAGVVMGAVCAATMSMRYADADDEGEMARMAGRAIVIATVLPLLAGFLCGAGAAVGLALGFTAWAAASMPLATGEGVGAAAPPRLSRYVLLTWGRMMALTTVVGVPLMI